MEQIQSRSFNIPISPYSGAEAQVSYRGCYERTDVRLPDGKRLAPLPILQFIDKKARRTFAVLPDFLVSFKHYLVCVIESAVQDYASGAPPAERICSASGPDESTLKRWCSPLEDSDIHRAMEKHLQQMSLNWRAELLPAVECEYPCPSTARPMAWESLQMLRCLKQLTGACDGRTPYHYLQELRLRCSKVAA